MPKTVTQRARGERLLTDISELSGQHRDLGILTPGERNQLFPGQRLKIGHGKIQPHRQPDPTYTPSPAARSDHPPITDLYLSA
jgi:hypothetical protein